MAPFHAKKPLFHAKIGLRQVKMPFFDPKTSG